MKPKAIVVAGTASVFLSACTPQQLGDAVDAGCKFLPAATAIAKVSAAMFPGVAVLSIDQAGQVVKAACDAVAAARVKSQGKKALVVPAVNVRGQRIYLYPDPSRPNQR